MGNNMAVFLSIECD